jgi:putative hydrolase of the HAD superfamily
MLKAILFDLDDTLLDWRGFTHQWPEFEEAFLGRVFTAISHHIVPLTNFRAFVDDFRERIREAWRQGRGTLIAPNLGRVLVETAEAMGVPSGKVDETFVLNAYDWKAVPGTELFPEVLDVLKTIRDHGIRTGIVTNAAQPMRIRDIEISEFGLLEHFPECRISAADVGYLKPHPAIFQRALNELQAQPEEVIFVGDNPIADIAGAQGAGMQAILRITTPVPPMLSGLIIPDAAVNTLDEMLPLLDRWHPGWR